MGIENFLEKSVKRWALCVETFGIVKDNESFISQLQKNYARIKVLFPNFGGHKSFLRDHWYSCFSTSSDIFLSFKALVTIYLQPVTGFEPVPRCALVC